jgi:hypothetical protein
MVCFAGNTTTDTPTINSGASTTLITANAVRKFLLIQNNSAANIAIGLEGQTLTGIAPTSTNKCVVLPSTAGANILRFEDGFVPGSAITVYQTSGAPINTVVVVQG